MNLHQEQLCWLPLYPLRASAEYGQVAKSGPSSLFLRQALSSTVAVDDSEVQIGLQMVDVSRSENIGELGVYDRRQVLLAGILQGRFSRCKIVLGAVVIGEICWD